MQTPTLKSTAFKTTLLAALIAGSSISYASAVDNTEERSLKSQGVGIGTFIAGAALGGPVGAFAGLFAADWVSDTVDKADKTEDLEAQLAQKSAAEDSTARELAATREQLKQMAMQTAQLQSESNRQAQLMMDQLMLEMFFRTDDSQLTATSQQRLYYLADFLNNNAQLQVRIDGFADPRGDADYNLSLSQKRAELVANHLADLGVSKDRFSVNSHGDSQSVSKQGDYDGYALERVVKITIVADQDSGLVKR